MAQSAVGVVLQAIHGDRLSSTQCIPTQLELPQVGRRRLVARSDGGTLTSREATAVTSLLVQIGSSADSGRPTPAAAENAPHAGPSGGRSGRAP